MNAFILAAGLGTRLRPLTDTMPKALIPVCGKPLLQILLERLKNDGFDQIVVNVHHFASQITDFLNANQNFGLDMRISNETGHLLGTGGAIRKGGQLFTNGKPFLVHNVDILHNLDLRSFYKQNAQPNEAVLLTSPRKTQRYLAFETNDTRLMGWTNLKTGEVKSPFPGAIARLKEQITTGNEYLHLSAFSGIHIVPANMVNAMQTWPEEFSIIDFYLDACAQGTVRGVEKENLKLVDVGKLDTLHTAESFLQEING